MAKIKVACFFLGHGVVVVVKLAFGLVII